MNRGTLRKIVATPDGVRLEVTTPGGQRREVTVDPAACITLSSDDITISNFDVKHRAAMVAEHQATIDQLQVGDVILSSGQPASRVHAIRT